AARCARTSRAPCATSSTGATPARCGRSAASSSRPAASPTRRRSSTPSGPTRCSMRAWRSRGSSPWSMRWPAPARFAEASRQAAVADLVVVSKTDLQPLSPELARRLAALNPTAEIVCGAASDDPAALLFGRGRRTPALPDAAAAHSHGIDSFAVAFAGAISRLDFARALGTLARERGSDLLRVKGIVAFADGDPRPALIQAAQHA